MNGRRSKVTNTKTTVALECPQCHACAADTIDDDESE